jgi:hypothetical protein
VLTLQVLGAPDDVGQLVGRGLGVRLRAAHPGLRRVQFGLRLLQCGRVAEDLVRQLEVRIGLGLLERGLGRALRAWRLGGLGLQLAGRILEADQVGVPPADHVHGLTQRRVCVVQFVRELARGALSPYHHR